MRRVFLTAYIMLLRLTPPVALPKNNGLLCICSITSHEDLGLYLLTIKSFLYFSGLRIPVLVVDDGSLTQRDIGRLRHHLVNIRIVRKRDADQKMRYLLSGYPYCKRYRFDAHPDIATHNQKLFDPVLLSGSRRFILLDSDVLFFSRPQEVIRWVKTGDTRTLFLRYPREYIDEGHRWGILLFRVLAKLSGHKEASYVNSGLICATETLFQLPIVEVWTKKYYQYKLARTWIGDQPIFAQLIYTSTNARRGLPDRKYIILTDPKKRDTKNVSAIHYHMPENKTFAHTDGVKLLWRTQLFTARRSLS